MENNHKLPGIFSLLAESLNLLMGRKMMLFLCIFIPFLLSMVLGYAGSYLGEKEGALMFDIGAQIVGSIFFGLGMLVFLKSLSEPEGTRFEVVLGKSFRLLIPFFILCVVYGLAVTAGFIFFIIPGVLLSVWLLFSMYILLEGNTSIRNSFSLSREYARGLFWPIFGRVVGFGLLLSVFVFCLILAGGAAAALFSTFNEAIGLIVGSLIFLIVVMISYPLQYIYNFVLYRHIKAMKGEQTAQSSFGRNVFIVSILGVFVFAGLIALAIAAPRFIQKLENTRGDVKMYKSDIDIQWLETALELHFIEHGEYPEALNELVPQYMEEVPLNSVTGLPYVYAATETGYELCPSQADVESGENCVRPEEKMDWE